MDDFLAEPAVGSTIAHALVVDDDEDILDLLAHHLDADGYRVTKASSSAAALTLAARESFDLLVLDIVLPGDMDGFGLCRALRQTARNAATPALYVSGYADDEGKRIQAYMTGVSTIVSKPVVKQELLAAARSLILREEDLRAMRRLQGQMPLIAALSDSLYHSLSSPLLSIRYAAHHLENKVATAKKISAKSIISDAKLIDHASEDIGKILADIKTIARGGVDTEGRSDATITVDHMVSIVATLSTMRFASSGVTVSQLTNHSKIGNRIASIAVSAGGVVCAFLRLVDDAIAWLAEHRSFGEESHLLLGARQPEPGLAALFLLAGGASVLSFPERLLALSEPNKNQEAAKVPAEDDKLAEFSDSLNEGRIFAEVSGASIYSTMLENSKISRLHFPLKAEEIF